MPEILQSPASHSYISQRLRLNYLDWGDTDAPVLILLHGARDHAHSWDWVARSLQSSSQKDWHIIAPDLRGHGDSAWSPDGAYLMPYFIYDLAQLIHQLGVPSVAIVAHSLGGNIAAQYTGLYPQNVSRLVVIEGLGLPPDIQASLARKSIDENWREWIAERRGYSTRMPRRYQTIDEAFERMRVENAHLSMAQAKHLTIHGISRNEDGTFSWKFDNLVRLLTPLNFSAAEMQELWGRIACPVLLVNGRNSWAPDPAADGKLEMFQNARAVMIENAGHWPHHDQFDIFMRELKGFL